MHTVLCFCMYAPLVRLVDHFMLNCAEHNITLLYSDIFSATWRPSWKKQQRELSVFLDEIPLSFLKKLSTYKSYLLVFTRL